MKQFLVPALLLALVGAAAAIAAGSAPAASTPAPAAECHALTGMSGECPFSGGNHCDAAKGAMECTSEMAEKCTPAMADKCPMADKSEDCEKQCEEMQERDCCKKKVECSKCEKHEEPAQKP